MSERDAKEARRAARQVAEEVRLDALGAHEQQIRIHARAINNLIAENAQLREDFAMAMRQVSRTNLQRLRSWFGY